MKRLMLVALSVALTACSGPDHEDLRQWMDENTRNLRGKITPLPEVKPYAPVPYQVEAQIDPFRASKIEPDAKLKQAGKGGQFEPDYEARELRNSELEKIALESLTMIGRVNINNTTMALIKYEGNVKQVRVGDYIGLDFGRITEITENEVKLHELFQDSAGDWSERQSSLHLQTTEGGSK